MCPMVPKLIGLDRNTAEAELDARSLRHIAQFHLGIGISSINIATAQDPAAFALVAPYSVVTVSYTATKSGPDSPVEGPTPPSGIYQGQIDSVLVGNPEGTGTGEGAWVGFSVVFGSGERAHFTVTLYCDQNNDPTVQLPRTEWMKRGAMLALAQRAFANGSHVRIFMTSDLFAKSIEITNDPLPSTVPLKGVVLPKF